MSYAGDGMRAAELMVSVLNGDNQLLMCGNGGTAADAQYFTAEVIGRFERDRKALPAIALTTDTSILTALGNDYGYDSVFARQVEGLSATPWLWGSMRTSWYPGLKGATALSSRSMTARQFWDLWTV
jgi:phosphoheptose isomerase